MSYERNQPTLVAARPAANPAKPKSRPVPGQPFDPNELSLRLRLVLAEQKAASEKKRRVRAEVERHRKEATIARIRADGHGEADRPRDGPALTVAPAPTSDPSGASRGSRTKPSIQPTSVVPSAANDRQPNRPLSREPQGGSRAKGSKTDSPAKSSSETKGDETHPYVPREAASQFARTTTSAGMMLDGSLAHRLSRQALKAHLMGQGNDRGVERKKSLRKSQSNLDRLTNRAAVQHSRIPEESAGIERIRDTSNHRHTFQGSLGGGRKSSEMIQESHRRSSTGDLLEAYHRNDEHRQSVLVEEAIDGEDDLIDPATADEHRVDWTQSDEAQRSASANALRPKPSFWTLRGRLGGFRHREDKSPSPPERQADGPALPLSPKSPRTGFFSRFKH